MRVMPTSGLTEAEIARITAEAESAKDADQRKREVADLKLQLEALLYTSERALAEYGHVLMQMDREAMVNELSTAKKAMDSNDPQELRQAQSSLELVAQKIGEAMYSQASGGGDNE